MTGQERGPAPPLSRAETTAVLSEVLRRVRGADARLVDWTAERLKHGRHPVVRYDVRVTRSEEHTSELQSRFDLVCRLLLEKKKKTIAARAREPSGALTGNF